MSKKKISGMDELLEAVAAAINSAAPSSRDALAKTIAAYRKESPDDYLWATGPQVPALLNRLMIAVTPDELAQPRRTRKSTSVRDFLYKACRSGRWPVRCIEGFENWETGPIRFFYADFRSKFHAWRKRSGDGGRKMNFLGDEIEEVHPTCSTRLRWRVPEGSDVARSPSDGRAQAIELPSLIDCRKDFDRFFNNPQDWPVKSAPPALDDACVAANDVEGVVISGFIAVDEFAKLAGMTPSSIRQYHAQNIYGFPKAQRRIGMSIFWQRSTALDWIRKHKMGKVARRNAHFRPGYGSNARDRTTQEPIN